MQDLLAIGTIRNRTEVCTLLESSRRADTFLTSGHRDSLSHLVNGAIDFAGTIIFGSVDTVSADWVLCPTLWTFTETSAVFTETAIWVVRDRVTRFVTHAHVLIVWTGVSGCRLLGGS